MENNMAIKTINDFFNKKIERFIADKFKKLLSEFKKKEGLKTTIDTLGQQYDANKYNQWVKDKLNSLVLLMEGSDKASKEVLTCANQALMCFENNLNSIDLKETLTEKFDKIKKLIKSQIKIKDFKFACTKILGEKQIKDNDRRTREILALFSKTNPDVAETIQSIEQEAHQKFQIIQWLDDAAKNAKNVSIDVTHISKLTHSSAKGSNINCDHHKTSSNAPLLTTTNCASESPKDFAYTTAEYSPIAEFLQTDCNGELLGKLICEDVSILNRFANDTAQAKQWQEQFRLAFHEKQKSTHEFLKQVYFPVSAGYHLLTPLVSSRMAQIIHERIWQTRQKDTPAKNARKNGLFLNEMDISFLNTAILKTTQSNHWNASNLNNARTGRLTLLPASPPEWKKQPKPPTNIKTIFNKELGALTKGPIENLKKLLLAIKAKELSLNFKRKQRIADLISEIAEVLFDRVSAIQGQKNQAGWTLTSNLPVHQQYWLDPLRADDDFQTNRFEIDWPKDITNDFAKWLNSYLKSPRLTLGAPQEKHWRKLFTPLLREFNAVSDASLTDMAKIKEDIA